MKVFIVQLRNPLRATPFLCWWVCLQPSQQLASFRTIESNSHEIRVVFFLLWQKLIWQKNYLQMGLFCHWLWETFCYLNCHRRWHFLFPFADSNFFAISTFTLTSNLRLLPNVSTRTSFYHNFESKKKKRVKNKYVAII